jgi:hypothetical protein
MKIVKGLLGLIAIFGWYGMSQAVAMFAPNVVIAIAVWITLLGVGAWVLTIAGDD